MNIATALKDLRIEANLTQKDLAKKLNIGQSTIAQYERGDREPTIHNLSLYAKFFGVTVDELLGISEERAAGANLPMSDGASKMRNFGEILKEHRLVRGMTLKEIEKATGINNGNLSRWERGEVLPNIDFCVQLANFYGITIDELLGVSEERAAGVAAPTGDSVAADKAQNAQERELLKLFRELSPYLQDLTLQTVRNWVGKAGKPGAANVQK